LQLPFGDGVKEGIAQGNAGDGRFVTEAASFETWNVDVTYAPGMDRSEVARQRRARKVASSNFLGLRPEWPLIKNTPSPPKLVIHFSYRPMRNRHAAIGHALTFDTWRSLAREQGLTDSQAPFLPSNKQQCFRRPRL
jgi:hypothetical protein